MKKLRLGGGTAFQLPLPKTPNLFLIKCTFIHQFFVLRVFHFCSQRLCVLCFLVFCVVYILDLDHRAKCFSLSFFFFCPHFLHFHSLFSFIFPSVFFFFPLIIFFYLVVASSPYVVSSYYLVVASLPYVVSNYYLAASSCIFN